MVSGGESEIQGNYIGGLIISVLTYNAMVSKVSKVLRMRILVGVHLRSSIWSKR